MNKTLIEELEFNGTWRDYQQDFLDEIDTYLSDKKLNVVAAPGAGKTTLGVEIIRRLGNPTLILSPSITIKNQWKERVISNFLSKNADYSNISTDIKNIKTITSTTYQAVHTLLKNQNIKKNFISELKKYGIKTIILDESHHLRTEWYQTLYYLCKELFEDDFTIVSLTATPPYDVTDAEWQNYKSLCGPVDVEISIPELVKNSDLCPHQDILWFSNLSDEESKIINNFKKNKKDFFDFINKESDLSYAIRTSDFICNYEQNTELIYSDIDFTISIISYLLSLDDMDINATVISEFLCIEKEQIPKFNDEIAETLFNGILGKHKNQFKNIPLLRAKLKEFNLLSGKSTVDFKGNIDIKKIYAKSINKLKSIKEISKLEYKKLGKNLREVILLDYIGEKKALGLNVLSTFNIISELENELEQELNPAILTGSTIVIPISAKDELYKLIEKYKLKKENVLTTDFGENGHFLRVETYGNTNIVPIITELFSDGKIQILIGTQALLGEGWDAPCVNALIIASTVGSFMLSNQMRGRALRIDKNNPKKTANIWHLVSLSNENKNNENTDIEIIKKRFETFEGISFIDKKIQNGFNRLGYNNEDIEYLNIQNLNTHSQYLANCRNILPQMWKQVFDECIYTEKNLKPKVYETIQTPMIKLPQICYASYKNSFYKIIRNYIAKFYFEKEQQTFLGYLQGLLKTMCDLNIIMTDYENIKIINKINYDTQKFQTDTFLTITGCTNYERNLFIKTFEEMFSKPKNQRYILKKETKTNKPEFYPVPNIIGTKKNNIKILEKNLLPLVGYIDILYTRHPEGRKELLKAICNYNNKQKIKTSKVWF